MKVTPERVTRLEPNQVFVFGSNMAGRHGKGAALDARERFGARQGTAKGPTGRCYAIPTKNGDLQPLPPDLIGRYLAEFCKYAAAHPEQEFLLTPVGCGLAGYDPRVIAGMLFVHNPPSNVILPRSFLPYVP